MTLAMGELVLWYGMSPRKGVTNDTTGLPVGSMQHFGSFYHTIYRDRLKVYSMGKTTEMPVEKSVEESYCNLIERYEKPMFAYVYSRLRNREAAEDVIQETWLRAYRSMIKGSIEPSQLPGWLYGIARNCCHEWRRDEKRQALSKNQPESVKATNPSKEKIINMVLAAIQDLPDEPRIILTMKYINQMTYEQIAQTLNKPMGTVKSIFSRAYDTIQDLVGTKLKEVEL